MDLPTISNTQSYTQRWRIIFGRKKRGANHLPRFVTDLQVVVSLVVFWLNTAFNVSVVFIGVLIYVCECMCVYVCVCHKESLLTAHQDVWSVR